MSNLILIPENLMAISQATVVASSEASASMAKENMLTESPSEFWRSSSNAPGNTLLYFYLKSLAMSIDAIAIVGHNLYRGDQYRIFLTDTAGTTQLGPTSYVPTSLEASTNATGSYTDVDEGETPDANWMTPTASNATWIVRFGFATPAFPPVVGADLQAFWVYVKAQSAPPTTAPTVTCTLYESGVSKSVLGTKSVYSTTGQWIYFTWNASSLGTANGSAVECRLDFSGTTGQSISLGSVLWAEDPNNSATMGGATDSGWVTYDPFAGSGITYLPQVEPQGNAILHVFAATYSQKWAHVHFRSDRTPADFDDATEILPQPHGFVQVGCVVIGETWSPAADRDFGPLVSTKDYSSKARTYGGQRFGSRRFVQRILSLPLNWLTPEEAHTLFDRILWRHGILKPIFVSILPGDATEEKHTSFLASLRNPENGIAATTTRGKSRAMTLEFEEEL